MPRKSVIDPELISLSSDLDEPSTCRSLLSAIEGERVVALKGDHIDFTLLDSCRLNALSFFLSDFSRKMAFHRPSRGLGYLPPDTESLAASMGEKSKPDPKESFNLGRRDNDQPWPADSSSFHSTLRKSYDHLDKIAAEILRLISLGLGLESSLLTSYARQGASVLRLTHYPAIQGRSKEILLRAGAHTDYGLLSLVYPDPLVSGFEVYSNSGWHEVRSTPRCLLLNIADLLARWTNNKLPPTRHRVTALPAEAKESRLSLVFLQNPRLDVMVQPLSPFIDSDHPPQYEPVLAEDYLKARSHKSRTLLERV